jgi:hypothetical protein
MEGCLNAAGVILRALSSAGITPTKHLRDGVVRRRQATATKIPSSCRNAAGPKRIRFGPGGSVSWYRPTSKMKWSAWEGIVSAESQTNYRRKSGPSPYGRRTAFAAPHRSDATGSTRRCETVTAAGGSGSRGGVRPGKGQTGYQCLGGPRTAYSGRRRKDSMPVRR